MPDFLLEIGVEEIPAGYIAPALDAFTASLAKALEAEGLAFESLVSTATPRRLVFFGRGLPVEQSARKVEIAGPPVRIAFDSAGKPTRAAEGFARAQGVSMNDISRRPTDRGDYLFAVKTIPAKPSIDVLKASLPALIRAIPFPKSMYWRDPAFRFARPLRRLLALFGADVIPFDVSGIPSGRLTVGHPFLAPAPIEIPRADLALLNDVLRKAHVLLDRDERRSKILSQVETALAAHGGKLTELDLLEEVTDLVEWPEILEGSFSHDFLSLPEEVVATAMMEHQRYFPVRDASGKLVNRFLTISNRPREYRDLIRDGNQRVLAARLNDARFFWDADVKVPLEKVSEGLSSVMYLAGLGTVAQKVERMKKLAAFAAASAGLANFGADAVQAAALSKADLLTEMVFEFPSLQGVMGRAYALAQGKPPAVAAAIEEHYLPRTLSGQLPSSMPGRLVALADKADALAGAFAMGLIPSGSQDPYGLRRASIGIVRIIVDGRIRLNLRELLLNAWQFASKDAKESPKAGFDDLLSFVRERFYQFHLDRGARHDVLRACLASGFDDVLDFTARLDAIAALSAESFWSALVTIVERTCNITRNYSGPDTVDPKFLVEDQERLLYDLFTVNASSILDLIAARDYVAASHRYLDVFGRPLHDFFDKVFVNVDDLKVRNNRLALVRAINRLYSQRIADLAQIVQQGA